jgi:DNA-binding response OmpR family regulator
MSRILSISYDESLLQTRAMLLERAGYEVDSALGFSAAIHACKTKQFDLVVLGHSIPVEDKEQIISH